jgi:hypothetical protein
MWCHAFSILSHTCSQLLLQNSWHRSSWSHSVSASNAYCISQLWSNLCSSLTDGPNSISGTDEGSRVFCTAEAQQDPLKMLAWWIQQASLQQCRNIHYIYKSMWTPFQMSGLRYFSHTGGWQVYKIEHKAMQSPKTNIGSRMALPNSSVTFNVAPS